jgi:hypothetical protein
VSWVEYFLGLSVICFRSFWGFGRESTRGRMGRGISPPVELRTRLPYFLAYRKTTCRPLSHSRRITPPHLLYPQDPHNGGVFTTAIPTVSPPLVSCHSCHSMISPRFSRSSLNTHTLGKLVGFTKITRDMTERHLADKRIIADYEEASKLKSQFLANMSHEIR